MDSVQNSSPNVVINHSEIFLILSFRLVQYVICFLLVNSLAG